MFLTSMSRAIGLGSRYGLKGIAMFADSNVKTPEMGEGAMEGAVGIVNFGMYKVYTEAELPSQPLS